VSGDQHWFPFRDVAMAPVASRRMPVWVAATAPPTVELAAERGLPLLLGMHDDDDAKAAMVRHHAAVAGGTVAGHASAHLAFVADTIEDAESVLRRAMPGWLAAARASVRVDGSDPPGRDLGGYLEHLLAVHPVGPPQRCVQRLHATLATTDVRRLLLMAEGGGDLRRTLDNIERLGCEVLPALRAVWH
jgi:alkanesulfonate monooxygenase SsuD/methylene tetrahydromethanopterin reductase-like flavin-dependent oxidoreductase (luciferase family)